MAEYDYPPTDYDLLEPPERDPSAARGPFGSPERLCWQSDYCSARACW